MISDIMRSLRDIMVISEKIATTTALARQADQRSIELGERVARVEAVLDYALHGASPRGPTPPAPPLPGSDRG